MRGGRGGGVKEEEKSKLWVTKANTDPADFVQAQEDSYEMIII